MMSINHELKWITSLGGPLILMERAAIEYWRGTAPDSTLDGNTSDYERAGELTDYVSKIDFADQVALVFAMPNDTTLLSLSSRLVLVVRWIWADGYDQVLDVLRKSSPSQEWNTSGIEITFESREIVLFDSVYDGKQIVDSVSAEIEPGCYSVAFVEYQPSSETNLLIFKLEKLAD